MPGLRRVFSFFEKALLGGYLGALFVLEGLLAWHLAREHHRWAIGDWLINYRGGFVRRGLLGEMLYWLGRWTHTDPAFWVAGLQTALLALFFLAAYLALLRQPDLRPYAVLLSAPFLFPFPLLDVQGAFRKEILLFALWGLLLLVALYRPQHLPRTTLVLFGLYPALILTHEMTFFYLPYLFVPLLWQRGLAAFGERRGLWGALAVANLLALAAAGLARGQPEQVEAIFRSLRLFHPWEKVGAIAYLARPLTCYLCRRWGWADWSIFGRVFPAAALAFLPIRERLVRFWRRPPVRGAVLLAWVFSLVLFVIAKDWGRFVYVHLLAGFLFSLLDTRPLRFRLEPREMMVLVYAFAFVYFDLWYLHHVRGFQLVLPPEDNLRRLFHLARQLFAGVLP